MGGHAVADPQADLRSRPHDRLGVAARVRPGGGVRRPDHGDDVPVVRFGAGRTQRRGSSVLSAVWWYDIVGMVLDAGVDWDEVAELLTESYCVLAPKKLVALVDRA